MIRTAKQAEAIHSRGKGEHQPQESPAWNRPASELDIYRKASCPCGGGCPACQAKSNLSISQPNDPAEIEADAIADKVMKGTPPGDVRNGGVSGTIHPKRNNPGAIYAGSEVSSQIIASRKGGTPLDPGTRGFMESRFGTDFSQVRIHTGHEATAMNKELSAVAFTHGNDIYFDEGKYRPESKSGRRLLAHELAHTIQQKNSFLTIQRQDVEPRKELQPGLSLPWVIPPFTNRDIALPCPDSVNSLVKEFIREAHEYAVKRLSGEKVIDVDKFKTELYFKSYFPETVTQIAINEWAWRYLAKWRQAFPAETPRDPTDADLAIASAEHYYYARYTVSNGDYSFNQMSTMVNGYTMVKDTLRLGFAEDVISADGNTPTRPTRCQNDWGQQGAWDGYADWLAAQPKDEPPKQDGAN